MPRPDIAKPIPPQLFSAIPRAAAKLLEPGMLMRDALANGPTVGSMVAFLEIQRALLAAQRQQRRIAVARRHWAEGVPSKRAPSVFDEVHFYLICWVRAARMASLLSRSTRFRQLGLVLRRYERDIKAVTDARHHLEHLEERLVDGPARRKLKQPHDIYNMVGEKMSFGVDRLDVGSKGFRVLQDFVSEIEAAVLYDSLERLAQTNRDLLLRRLQETVRDVETNRLMRRMGMPAVRKRR